MNMQKEGGINVNTFLVLCDVAFLTHYEEEKKKKRKVYKMILSLSCLV